MDTEIEMAQVRVVGKKVGRPGTITDAVERALFEQVGEGSTVREACRLIKAGYRSVMRRAAADDEFRQRLARAREAGVEANLEEVEELLRGANNKNISVVRELAHHLRWKASKLKPRNYGDRVSAEVSGPAGEPLGMAVVLTPMDWDKLIAKVTRQEPAATVPEAGGGCRE